MTRKRTRFQQRLFATLRYGVMKTSGRGTTRLYRACYTAVLRLIVWRLRRLPGIHAIYVDAGMARGEAVPGISDIDLKIVYSKDQYAPENRAEFERIVQTYARLAKWFPLLDDYLDIYDIHTLRGRHRHCYRERQLFQETAKRLYGVDILQSLPRLPTEEVYNAAYPALSFWWRFFCAYALDRDSVSQDPILVRSICYRTIAGVSRLNRSLREGELQSSRASGLAWGAEILDALGQDLTERATHLQETRFLQPDPRLRSDTLRFFVQCMSEMHHNPPQRALWKPLRNATQSVDSPPAEQFAHPDLKTALPQIACFAREAWGDAFAGLQTLSSVYFGLEEPLIWVRLAHHCLKDADAMTTFSERCGRVLEALSVTTHLCLAVDGVGFRLPFQDRYAEVRLCLISPEFFPDIFLQLEETPLHFAPIWTDWSEKWLVGWRHQWGWDASLRILAGSADALSDAEFLRAWWKGLQLMAVEWGATQGQIVYPLTLPAVVRALEAMEIPLPPSLACLEVAYRALAAGQKPDIAPLRREATHYLRCVNSVALLPDEQN